MKLQKHLTYGNVMATVAVFLSLGGGAYALRTGSVNSREIKNNTIRSQDVRNRSLKGRDVHAETLGRKQIIESRLDASKFSAAGSGGGLSCDPSSTTFVDCADVTLGLPRPGKVLIVVAGGQESVGGPAAGDCRIEVNGDPGPNSNIAIQPGQEGIGNTSGGATEGFALTGVTSALKRGRHTFSLACNQRVGNTRIDEAHISAFMIGADLGG